MSGALSTMALTFDPSGDNAANGVLLVEALGRTFAIAVAAVRSIERIGRVAKTQGGPDFLIGFASVKGAILPVLSLGRRLDRNCPRGEASPFVVIVEATGRIAAFSVDKIGAVVRVAAGDVLPAPHKLEMAMAPFTAALLRRKGALAAILDAGALLEYPLLTGESALRRARLN
jgi:purine-binding chemotaxis protein CheW